MNQHNKGTRRSVRLLSLLVVLSLLLPAAMAAQTGEQWGYSTVNDAKFRPRPGTTDYIDNLPVNWPAKILGTETVGGVLWYKVHTNTPTRPTTYVDGYMRNDVFRPMTAAEQAAHLGQAVPAPTAVPQPSGQPAQGLSNQARVIVGGTNLRPTPGGSTTVVGLLDGAMVTVLQTPADLVNGWYQINASGFVGYVPANSIKVLTWAELGTVPNDDTPGTGATAAPVGPAGYIKLVKPGVNLRQTPGGNSQKQLAINTILPYYGSPQNAMGYTWAYVQDAQGTWGYVRNDCYVFTDKDGTQVAGPTPAPGPVIPPVVGPTAAPGGGATLGTITLIRGGVNLRVGPGGKSLGWLDRGTVLPYYGFTQQGGYSWYYVMSTLGAGYVRSDMARLASGETPVLPPAPGGTEQAVGYVLTVLSNINLRRTPNTNAAVLEVVPRNTIWPLIHPVVNNDGYNWYFVRTNQHTGYLRGDTVRQLTNDEVTAYLAGQMPGHTPTQPTDPAVTTGHIATTHTSVNIRQTPSLSATQVTQVANAGTVFPYTGTVLSGGQTWYRITYNGQVAYMMGRFARVLTATEYQQWLNEQQGVVTPTPSPVVTAPPSTLSNVAVTVMDRVLLRTAAGMNTKTQSVIYKQGTQVTLVGQTANASNYFWYQVSVSGQTGWVRSDMLRVLTQAEAGTLTPTAPVGTQPQEATYPTLSRGSTGEAVTRLQTELSRLGFLPASSITGVYTTETQEAVRRYQEAAGLFIDGIAGSNTQHKMYGTVPPGTYTPPVDGAPTLYPVEKVDWYTGDIQRVWTNGTVATLTDVATGLSYRAKRWAGGYHADVEPLTAADTAVYVKMYGVTSAQQIAEKNLWQRRPTWVTVGGRTFAASIYGVPHNYPQGDTIKDNDFNGQFCVHFVNSRTHSTARVDSNHMKAIDEAYNKAPSRK